MQNKSHAWTVFPDSIIASHGAAGRILNCFLQLDVLLNISHVEIHDYFQGFFCCLTAWLPINQEASSKIFVDKQDFSKLVFFFLLQTPEMQVINCV